MALKVGVPAAPSLGSDPVADLAAPVLPREDGEGESPLPPGESSLGQQVALVLDGHVPGEIYAQQGRSNVSPTGRP